MYGVHQVFAEWERLSVEQHKGALVPPSNWRAPPPAGYVDAQGMRRTEDDPWRPVRLGGELVNLQVVTTLAGVSVGFGIDSVCRAALWAGPSNPMIVTS